MGATQSSPCRSCGLGLDSEDALQCHMHIHRCRFCSQAVDDYNDLQVHLLTACPDQGQLYARTRGMSYLAISSPSGQRKALHRESMTVKNVAKLDKLIDEVVDTNLNLMDFGLGQYSVGACSEMALILLHRQKPTKETFERIFTDASMIEKASSAHNTFAELYMYSSRYKEQFDVLAEAECSTNANSKKGGVTDLIELMWQHALTKSLCAVVQKQNEVLVFLMRRSDNPEIVVFDASHEKLDNSRPSCSLLTFESPAKLSEFLLNFFPYRPPHHDVQDKDLNSLDIVCLTVKEGVEYSPLDRESLGCMQHGGIMEEEDEDQTSAGSWTDTEDASLPSPALGAKATPTELSEPTCSSTDRKHSPLAVQVPPDTEPTQLDLGAQSGTREWLLNSQVNTLPEAHRLISALRSELKKFL